MPKKAKIGKNRKDKFYNIAKEVGYRARSAFKLVQLNRKFQFLQNSRVLIDLCAAPGGWLQVAKQHMPVESVICGVDLVPIKAITGVTTFVDDITTDSCKSKLRAHLKDWKVDVVLNDGAPNVGKNWHLDSFSQAEITLMAAKLAAFFLRPGGWFITKVFRSADYNGLVWVLKQLFKKVHATKPTASRNESAEIFVVCQGYLAPSKIDPKFFDIKCALQQVESDQKRVAFRDIDRELTKKRKAVGYDDDQNATGLLYREKTDLEFFEHFEPLEFLAKTNKILLSKEMEGNELYTEDIKIFCADIRLLDTRSQKVLLKWRTKMRNILKMEKEEEKEEEEVEELDSEEEEEKQLEAEVLAATKEELKDLRRKKKLRGKSLRHLRDLISNTVQLDHAEDMELFNLSKVGRKHDDAEEHPVDTQTGNDSELESGDEEDLPPDFDPSRAFDLDEEQNELIVPIEDKETIKDRQAKNWFSQDDWFNGLADGSELDDANLNAVFPKAKKPRIEKAENEEPETSEKMETDEPEMEPEQEEVEEESEDETDSDTDSEDEKEEAQRAYLNDMENRIGALKERRDEKEYKKSKKSEERTREQFPLTPRELAIATEMVTSKKRKRDLEELMYDKNSFNDPTEPLPEWFTVDEKRHRFRRLPEVDQNLVSMYAERQKAANARTIKKVAEARARKKRRFAKKQEKARKAAEGVLSQDDVGDREKQAQIKRIYNKAGLKKEKEKVTYVPIKQGAGRRVPRPAGVKGKFKVVDSRMKTDMRAQKAAERRAGKRPSGGRGLNNARGKGKRSARR